MTVTGLRERKKQRTREQIVEAAFGLFRERGFQATTVADIAAAADIAPRTFFAYFPSKEAVVFHDFDALFASLKETIEGRPEGETAIDALRRWLDESLPRQARRGRGRASCASACASTSPRWPPTSSTCSPSSRTSCATASRATSASPRTACARSSWRPPPWRRWARSTTSAPTRRESMALLDETLVFLRGGVAALQERSS